MATRQVPIDCSLLARNSFVEIGTCHSGKSSCWFDAAIALMFNYRPKNDKAFRHTKSIFELFYDEFYRTGSGTLAEKYDLKKFIPFIESYGSTSVCIADIFGIKTMFVELFINLLLNSPDVNNLETRRTILMFIHAYLTIDETIKNVKDPMLLVALNKIVEELDAIFPNARNKFKELLIKGGGKANATNPIETFVKSESNEREAKVSHENYKRGLIIKHATEQFAVAKQNEYIGVIYEQLRIDRKASHLIAKLLIYYAGFDSLLFFNLVTLVLGRFIFSEQIQRYITGTIDISRNINNTPHAVIYNLLHMGHTVEKRLEDHIINNLKFDDTKEAQHSPFIVLRYDCTQKSNGFTLPSLPDHLYNEEVNQETIDSEYKNLIESHEYKSAKDLLDNPLKFDVLKFSHVTYELAGIFVNINQFKPVIEYDIDNPSAQYGMPDERYNQIDHAFSIIRCDDRYWIFDNEKSGNESFDYFKSDKQKQKAHSNGILYESAVTYVNSSQLQVRYFMRVKPKTVSFVCFGIRIPFEYGTISNYYEQLNDNEDDPVDPDYVLFTTSTENVHLTFDLIYHIRSKSTEAKIGGALHLYNKNKSLYSHLHNTKLSKKFLFNLPENQK